MITSAIIYLVYGVVFVLTLPLRLLPDVSTPSVIATTVSSISGYLASGWSWLPLTLTALLATWGIYLTVEAAIFLFKGFMWIIKKIPGIS